jgi:hypothetical protein
VLALRSRGHGNVATSCSFPIDLAPRSGVSKSIKSKPGSLSRTELGLRPILWPEPAAVTST